MASPAPQRKYKPPCFRDRRDLSSHVSYNTYRQMSQEYEGESSWDVYEDSRSRCIPNTWSERNYNISQYEDFNGIFGTTDTRVNPGVNFDKYADIPIDFTGPNHSSICPLATFNDIPDLPSQLAKNLQYVGFEQPTPVQKYAIPAILAGRDLMACAQTGSGKTAAFLFPIIIKMLNQGPPKCYTSRRSARPVCLILSPTRELAIQIYDESRKYTYKTGVRSVVVYGGCQSRIQLDELDKGCDICIATPGRLRDFLSRRRVEMKLIKFLVLDEGDRMLDMGFAPSIEEIVMQSDMKSHGRQTVMFSATFPKDIQDLAQRYLDKYLFLTVGRIGSTNDFIRQELRMVEDRHKDIRLRDLLNDISREGLTLVFVETKRKAAYLEQYLRHQGYKVVSIHGDRDQSQRESALSQFRSGNSPILVATDVAARGLDIPNINCVVNYDVPTNIDDYVHRIGRTGRAGNYGVAISFLSAKNSNIARDLFTLLEESGQEIPHWFTDIVRQSTTAGKGRFNDLRYKNKSNSHLNRDFRSLEGWRYDRGESNGERWRDYKSDPRRSADSTVDDGW